MATDDDWDFKVDRGVAPELAKTPKAKRPRLEDIAEAFSEKPVEDLRLDHESLPPRNTRIENFKKTVALERFADIKVAPISKRLQASIIDFFFILASCGIVWLSFPYWRVHLEKNLPAGLLGQVPDPETFLENALLVLTVFIVHIFPSCWWRKSLGKRLLSLRIGWKEDDCGVPKKAILWRELVVKPISCLSVVGVLLIFLDKRNRALHDYLSGTVVYDEL